MALIIIALVSAVLALRRKHWAGEEDDETNTASSLNESHRQVLEKINGMHAATEGLRGRARIKELRRCMDSMSDGLDVISSIRPSVNGAPKGEWVVAPGAAPNRRILYIHGGSWIAGSPKSHRAITDRLSRLANACVFALDYRLMPENRYQDGLSDCQLAYRWLLDNGPNGKETADFLVVAGDSAGGSHALVLIAWIRDQELPPPNAALALSPSTDLMLTLQSAPDKLKTDAMLGPSLEKLMRIPLPLRWLVAVLSMRTLPSSPLVSPLRGNLHQLPPTLIQVSESELLLENAQQYAAKAQAAGSLVTVQSWPDMVHVWHLFTPLLPEAEAAFAHVGEFLAQVEASAKNQGQGAVEKYSAELGKQARNPQG
ncbi:alpha/beta hydrolase [Oceanisphaera profunda]|nr:alpha/beta hydrolase [Oceanisphaera profunda]